MSIITRSFPTSSIGSSNTLSPGVLAPTARLCLLSCAPTARQHQVRKKAFSTPNSIRATHQHYRPSFASLRAYASQTGNGKMASPQFRIVTLELLKGIRDFWFSHADEEGLVLPGMPVVAKWFMGGAEFDGACTKQYKPALEEIRAANITSVEPLLEHLKLTDPLDYVSLMLLLDQMPRNIYRDAEAGPVFSYFDPIALSLILHIQTLSTPIFMDPKIRWQIAYRFWQTLPLSHSEDLKQHDLASKLLSQTEADMRGLLDATPQEEAAETDEYRKRAIGVFRKQPEVAEKLLGNLPDAEKKHRVILEQFGRYPHRNGALGRETTAEEKAYIEGGGDTFAPPKNDEEKAAWEAKHLKTGK